MGTVKSRRTKLTTLAAVSQEAFTLKPTPPQDMKRAPREVRGAEKGCRQRATLPPGFPGSTITAEGLNFRVRNGNGWVPLAMVTGNGEKVFTLCRCEGTLTAAQRGVGVDRLWRRGIGQALDRLVPVS